MPRYQFHVENGERLTADEWEELPNDDAARAEAELVAKELSSSLTGIGRRLVVTDEAGAQVAKIPLIGKS